MEKQLAQLPRVHWLVVRKGKSFTPRRARQVVQTIEEYCPKAAILLGCGLWDH